jgi:16S rRNA processing protein RimM
MKSPSRSEELIDLAAVVRAHGLRGELLLKPFNPGSELWPALKRVFLRAPDGAVSEHVVERGHLHGMQVILGLAGVRGRDAAEALRGSIVCVPRSALPEPAEDEHYLVDLVGLEVRDESGKSVGKVVEVLEYPSVCCLLVESDGGRIEVPDTERYVTAIDKPGGFVSVAHLDELEVLRVDTPKGRG